MSEEISREEIAALLARGSEEMPREKAKVKNFDILRFIADNAGLSIYEVILKAYNMGLSEQEPKTGHWIETAEEYYKAVNEYGGGVNEDTPYFVDDIACSVCLAKYSVIDNETERFDCCPSCGTKMVEPQESEGGA